MGVAWSTRVDQKWLILRNFVIASRFLDGNWTCKELSNQYGISVARCSEIIRQYTKRLEWDGTPPINNLTKEDIWCSAARHGNYRPTILYNKRNK
jgi:hypothetical protein